MKILIDGDILAYRAAYSCEDTCEDDGWHKIDSIVEHIQDAVSFSGDDWGTEMFLTGKGNFRYDIQPTYKGNRKERPKPVHLKSMREYIIEGYYAKVSEGQEADDDIAIRATQLGPTAIIASIDKDFLQVPCQHYNFNRGTLVKVNELEGLRFFYTQVLTGDTADNIFGLKGIGPVKGAKILKDATNEVDMWRTCLKAYDGDYSKVVENAKLLWLRRKEGQSWLPPTVK